MSEDMIRPESMDRRNFILGLGTVATVSGAVSVTAAQFASSVEAGADFRVTVERDLTVRRNEDVTPGDDPYAEESFDGNEPEVDELPLAFVNDEENEDLELELRLANEDTEGDDETFSTDPPLELENDGTVDENVGIRYNFATEDGSVGDGENEVGADTVAEIFQFEIDGTRVSPDPAEVDASDDQADPEEFVELDAGAEEDIELVISIDSDAVDEIGDAADLSGNPFEEEQETVQLLESIEIGVQDD